MSAPVHSLRQLQGFLADPERSYIGEVLGRTNYPVYGVLLWGPWKDGPRNPYDDDNYLAYLLNSYVDDYLAYLFEATGPNWLLVAFQPDSRYGSPDSSYPEDAYVVARLLGAEPTDLPCIVFFTDPKERSEILIVRLQALLTTGTSAPEMTQLFRMLGSIVNSCSTEPGDRRLSCLKLEIARQWPQASVDTRRPGALEAARETAVSLRSIYGALNAIFSHI